MQEKVEPPPPLPCLCHTLWDPHKAASASHLVDRRDLAILLGHRAAEEHVALCGLRDAARIKVCQKSFRRRSATSDGDSALASRTTSSLSMEPPVLTVPLRLRAAASGTGRRGRFWFGCQVSRSWALGSSCAIPGQCIAGPDHLPRARHAHPHLPAEDATSNRQCLLVTLETCIKLAAPCSRASHRGPCREQPRGCSHPDRPRAPSSSLRVQTNRRKWIDRRNRVRIRTACLQVDRNAQLTSDTHPCG